MTATLERDAVAAPGANRQRTGVLIVERTGRGALAAYAHSLCSHLAASGLDTYLLTPKRDEQPPVAGCPEYSVGTWLRDTTGRALPVRAFVEVVNLLALVYGVWRLRLNIVVWQSASPRRLDALTVRILHALHRRVVWTAHDLLPERKPLSYGQIGAPMLAAGLLVLWHPYLGVRFLPGALSVLLQVAGFFAACAGAWLLFRWFTVERGSWAMYVRKLYRRVDELVVLTDSDAETLRRNLPQSERVRVIPFGSLAFFVEGREDTPESRRHLGLPLRGNVALAVCEPDDPGVADLVGAVASIRARGDDIELVVLNPAATGGADRIAAAFAAAGVASGVSCLDADPFTPESGVYFEASDVVVLPQHKLAPHGLPMLALAYARPTVVTDTGGLATSVSSGTSGEISRSGDAASLAAAVSTVLFPRRRLRQRQYELTQRGAEQGSWHDVVSRYMPLLALRDTGTGRRVSTSSTNRAQTAIWVTVIWVTLSLAVTSVAKGLQVTNFALIGAIALPMAVAFFFTTSFEVKVLTSMTFILCGELFRRIAFPLPVQLVWSLSMYAALLHMIMQPPAVKLRLKGTRLFNACVLLFGGLCIAQVFNPNVTGVETESLRSLRTYLEPLLFYGVLLVYLQDRKSVRRMMNLYMVLGFLALLYGAKIAMVGYFGFERTYFQTIGAKILIGESRNVGTMVGAGNWGMWSASLFLLALGGILERRAFKHKAWLYLMLPLAAINAVSSGNRIALAVMAASVPVVLAAGMGFGGNVRVRAVLAMMLMGALAIVTWYWIPEEQGSRVGLNSKSPIAATRQKFGSLKNPKADRSSTTMRLEEGGTTLKALMHHPIGGGMGVLSISNFAAAFGSGAGAGGSLLGSGSGTDEARAHNKVPVKAGDYFYVNVVAELGVPGLIVMLALLLVALANSMVAYVRLRDPYYKVIALASTAWMVGNLVNGITNAAFYTIHTAGLFYLMVTLNWVMMAIEERESRVQVTEPERPTALAGA